MRICLVGHFVEDPDEGVRTITNHLSSELSKRHQVLEASIRDPMAWRRASRFAPQVLHFVLSPSNIGLVLSRLLASRCTGAKTVMSAPHPDPIRWGRLARLLRPDLTLAQSIESEQMFQRLGFSTTFFPNGVDCERFRPVPKDEQQRLRGKYRIAREKYVILHVGPLTTHRNVRDMTRLQRSDNQVVIVGRLSQRDDAGMRRELEAAGCMVWVEYLPGLEEVYALSDCYVFPTSPQNRGASIEMPLSVMEAMSCNLPVITTRFGALPRVFEEGQGLVFVDGDHDLAEQVQNLQRGGLEVGTRRMVLPYSWTHVVQVLEGTYERLLGEAQA
jgi:glycosyltransferase involved in cell wall biosynthesis